MVGRDYYPSNIIGSTIVNAVTGKPYNKCYVGSNMEKNFFRVIDSSGVCNSEGLKINGNRTPNKLFYDSKEQYINYKKLYNQSMKPVITLVD